MRQQGYLLGVVGVGYLDAGDGERAGVAADGLGGGVAGVHAPRGGGCVVGLFARDSGRRGI